MQALRTLLVLAALVPAVSFAQKKVPVEVSFAEGGVASSVARELREAIRTFTGPMALPESAESSSEACGMRVTNELAKPRIRLQLTGADAAAADNSAIAVTVLYASAMMPLGGAYIRSILLTCGADTAACANQILVKAHGSIEWLRERWPSIWNTL